MASLTDTVESVCLCAIPDWPDLIELYLRVSL